MPLLNEHLMEVVRYLEQEATYEEIQSAWQILGGALKQGGLRADRQAAKSLFVGQEVEFFCGEDGKIRGMVMKIDARRGRAQVKGEDGKMYGWPTSLLLRRCEAISGSESVQ